jgi:hypothetical protein
LSPVGSRVIARSSRISARLVPGPRYGGRSIPLELDAHLRRVEGEIEIEAAATAPHGELGMTWSPLGMIAPRSQLFVKGRLTPQTDGPA